MPKISMKASSISLCVKLSLSQNEKTFINVFVKYLKKEEQMQIYK